MTVSHYKIETALSRLQDYRKELVNLKAAGRRRPHGFHCRKIAELKMSVKRNLLSIQALYAAAPCAVQLTRLLAYGGSHGGSAVTCSGRIPNCMHE
jgi:hypothetical protein